MIREISKWILPPLLLAGVRWARNAYVEKPTQIKFKYGDFVVQCDPSHHLPNILAYLPDFGRNLSDIVLSLNVREPRVIS